MSSPLPLQAGILIFFGGFLYRLLGFGFSLPPLFIRLTPFTGCWAPFCSHGGRQLKFWRFFVFSVFFFFLSLDRVLTSFGPSDEG